jgi:heparan-alpha-glucosaminide N-acetyltransferase
MQKPAAAFPLRIQSIDVLRALTMLLMIFVNDLWSLKDIPDWLLHTKADEDGMGLSDVIFPAFLFIVGMSVPFSVQNRRSKGENTASICWHIVSRSFALLVMGIYLVNGENLNAQATGFNRGIYNSLCCLSFILLWNSYRKTTNPWVIRLLKLVAVTILVLLACLIRGGDDGNDGFQTYWYGILGIIGWTYLVTALIYAYSEKYPWFLALVWLGFIMLCVALHSNWINQDFLQPVLSFASVNGHVALAVGGVITSLIFRHYAKENKHRELTLVLVIIAIVLLAAGFYARNFFIISKIRSTPSWILICTSITIFAFIILHWLVDLKSKGRWFGIIKPAGTNTLLCYLLPYFAYALVVNTGWTLPGEVLTGAIGLIKSFVFALMMVVTAGWLGKGGIRLRL